jgi:hypothetical protein
MEVQMQIESPYTSARRKYQVWQEALKTDLTGILQERIGEEMENLIHEAQKREWDRYVAMNLEIGRKRDKQFDVKLATLIHYNDEIDEDERGRRWDSIDRGIADEVIDQLNAIPEVPWPEKLRGAYSYTDEEWDSAVKNFPMAQKAIQKIPAMHLERRISGHQQFWSHQREHGVKSSRKS